MTGSTTKQSRLITAATFLDCFAALAMTGSKALALARARAIYRFEMVPDRTSTAHRRIVIDDHARLPGRFFGRFATSATSELMRAI
jgi:hypothetical protein